jgi:hypothetical protein
MSNEYESIKSIVAYPTFNKCEFCYWSYYPSFYCVVHANWLAHTFCYLLCADTKYLLQHSYTSQNQRWCQCKGTSIIIIIDLCGFFFFFFFLVFSFVYCVYINAIEFCYWSYYPCCYCDTFCYLLCADTKYYLQHAYTSQNQRWCQSKGTSIVIIIDFLVFFFII